MQFQEQSRSASKWNKEKSRRKEEQGKQERARSKCHQLPWQLLAVLLKAKDWTDLESTLQVFLNGGGCWKLLEEQLNVGFLVVISILFLLMKRRHLLSSIQMRVTHVLEQSCGGLPAVLPKPLLLLIIFANKFVQAERERDEAGCETKQQVWSCGSLYHTAKNRSHQG